MQLPDYDDLTEHQQKRVNEFIIVTLYCDDEMLDGIDHQIPMNYKLYNRTLETLEKLGLLFTLKEFISDFNEFGN